MALITYIHSVLEITTGLPGRGWHLWWRTGKFLLIFHEFYVYDLRFKAWGPTIFQLSFKHCIHSVRNACKHTSLTTFAKEYIAHPMWHYSGFILTKMASQITGISIVCLIICSDQRKHQSSTSLAFVRGIHRWMVVSPHKGPIKWKIFSFDDVIMDM